MPVFFERRQLQLLEQDLAELLRRVDVELLAGQLEDPRGVARQLAFDVLRLRGQRGAVDADAGALDVGEHGDERHLELAEHLVQPIGHEQRRQPVRQLPRQVRALAGEVQRRLRRQLRNRHRLGAAAADVLLGQRLVAEMLERGSFERVARPRRVEQVAGEHRVERQPAQRDAVGLQHDGVELQIVADLADRRVFEQRLQPVERRAAVHLRRRPARRAGRRRLQRPSCPSGT